MHISVLHACLQVIEGDALEASSVREALRGHSAAINASGHAKDGHQFHLLFKGTDINVLPNVLPA